MKEQAEILKLRLVFYEMWNLLSNDAAKYWNSAPSISMFFFQKERTSCFNARKQ